MLKFRVHRTLSPCQIILLKMFEQNQTYEMTIPMIITLYCIGLFEMSRLLGAMKLKMREIVLVEKRPFSSADFRGQKYHMKDGTFRNNISKLRESGEVELGFRSRPAFHTLTGKKNSTGR